MAFTDADSADRRMRAVRVLADHVGALPRGAAVDLEDLCRRHPDLGSELRRLTAHFEQVDGVVTALLEGGGLRERLVSRYGSDVDPDISLDEPPGPARTARRAGPATPGGMVARLEERGPISDRYQTRREIARGGMGAILEVWDHDLRRTLAMKVALTRGLRADADAAADERLLTRFLEEAQVTAQLDHPGILPVHELGLDAEGRVFFTMPLVKGRDLAQVLELVPSGEEGWTLTRALNVILKVCDAMAYAHSKKVIHRDLKPANIMVGRFGEVYVMDWGLAKVLGRKDHHDLRLREVPEPGKSIVRTERAHGSPLMTMDGDVVGTPSYMSPEQARGDLEAMGPASDVYSIGCILYHLIAGHMPYVPPGVELNVYAVWGLVQSGPPRPLRQLQRSAPEELVAICEKAMARDLARRYGDTVDLAEDLRAFLEGRVVRAYATGAWPELRKWLARNRALAWTSAAALAAVVGGLGVAAWLQLRWQKDLGAKEGELGVLQTLYDQRVREIADMELVAAAKREEASELQERAREARDQAAKLEQELDQKEVVLGQRENEVERAQIDADRQTYIANMTGAAMNLEAGNFDEVVRRLEACPRPLRGWEWNHLSLGQNPALYRVPGGSWSALLTSAGQVHQSTLDGRIVVRDAQTGSERRAWRTTDFGVGCMCELAPRRVVYGGLDGGLRVVDALDGSVEVSWSTGERAVGDVAVAGDGAWLITVEGYRYQRQFTGVLSFEDKDAGPAGIAVWDAHDGHLLTRVDGAHESSIRALAVHPDGRRVFTAGSDRSVVAWSLERGADGPRLTRTGELGGSLGVVQALALDPSGARLVGASQDRTVEIWNLERGELEGKLVGHSGAVLDVCVTPDGRRAVTASEDKTVRLWDLDAHEELAAFNGHDGAVSGVAISADGGRILSNSPDDGLRAWDTNTSDPVTVLGRLDHRLAPLTLAYGDRQGGKPAPVWTLDLDPDDAQPALVLDEVALAGPDGRTLVHRGRQRRLRKTFTFDLWDLADGSLRRTFAGHEDRITAFSWAPDGRTLASASADRTLRLWDVASGDPVASLGPFEAGCQALAFDPRGERLAFGLADGRVYLHDLASGESREADVHHDGAVRSLVWDARGERLASGSADGTILLFLARAEGLLPLHDRLRGHGGDVRSLALHPDGVRLFSGADDGTVRVWHVETGLTLLALTGMRNAVVRLAFEREGRRMITVEDSLPPTVRVWDSDLGDAQDMWLAGEWSRRAHALLNRSFAGGLSRDEVRARVLDEEVEEPVRAIALRLLARDAE